MSEMQEPVVPTEEENVIVSPCFNCPDGDTEDECFMVWSVGQEQRWCQECYSTETFTCNECDQTYDSGYYDSGHVVGVGNVCDGCISDYYWWCESCDEYRSNNDSCCNDEADNYTYNYSYKPDPVFHGDSDIQFGIELECENVHRNNSEAAGHFVGKIPHDVAYLKEDGSLTGGFEIVTHPRDLDSWREFAPHFLKVLNELNHLGQRAWNRPNCGLHVHMSKAGMSPAHQTRFGLLFSRNELDWKEAARRSSGYANFNGLKRGGVPLKVLQPYESSHSDAVNFANQHTIEVRIFRPSFSLRWLGCIELVAAARDYTHGLTSFDVARGALDWPKFAQYVARGKFPHAARVIAGEPFTGMKEVLPCA